MNGMFLLISIMKLMVGMSICMSFLSSGKFCAGLLKTEDAVVKFAFVLLDLVINMAKERRKIVAAGNLWMAVQYTAIHGGNQSQRRDARLQISNPARESLNAKMSWQKLMLSLAANFQSNDLVVSLSYRDSNLPARKEDADRLLGNFIRSLRQQRALLGHALIYVRVTEGYHSGGRLHHHLIVNAVGDDYSLIRSLWSKYGDNVDFEQFGADGAERWGKYLTKEPREKGRRHVGDRTWRSSIHMKKPIVTSELVGPEEPLEPPANSFVIDKTQCENSYGRFYYVMAMLRESSN